MKIIQPPEYPAIDADTPVIFLAGPIVGARNWQQNEAIPIFEEIRGENFRYPKVFCIASPRRSIETQEDFDAPMFREQVAWETHFLARAGKRGAVLFWLAKEELSYWHVVRKSKTVPRAFAQTSRFEVGEWLERARRDGANVVIGIEQGFTGGRYIRERIDLHYQKYYPHVSITVDLRYACREALRLCS